MQITVRGWGEGNALLETDVKLHGKVSFPGAYVHSGTVHTNLSSPHKQNHVPVIRVHRHVTWTERNTPHSFSSAYGGGREAGDWAGDSTLICNAQFS